MAFSEAMKSMGGPKAPKTPSVGKPKPKKEPKAEGGGEQHEGGSDSMSVEKGGEDGSYHTSDGQQHPHLGAALMHVAHHHEPGGKHMHVHSDGYSLRSHGVHEGGEHDGPHDHQNLDELKQHMDQFLGEEQQEGDGQEQPMEGHPMPQHQGMGGF
jgi:hypothetical protein